MDPTGTIFPGFLDGPPNGYSSVSTGDVIAPAYGNCLASAILAIEQLINTNPLDGTPYSTMAQAFPGIIAAIQGQSFIFANDTGSANSYAMAQSPTPANYTPGQIVAIKIANTNTGNSTLAVNGQSPQTIYKYGNTTLVGGELQAGSVVLCVYVGPGFQLVGGGNISHLAVTQGGTGLDAVATGDLLYGSATNTLSRLGASTDGYVLELQSGVPSWQPPAGGSGDTVLAGDGISVATVGNLATVTSTLVTGLSGGQTVYGDTLADGNITINSTSNTTLGTINFQSGLASIDASGDLSAVGGTFSGTLAVTGFSAVVPNFHLNDPTGFTWTSGTGNVTPTSVTSANHAVTMYNSTALGNNTIAYHSLPTAPYTIACCFSVAGQPSANSTHNAGIALLDSSNNASVLNCVGNGNYQVTRYTTGQTYSANLGNVPITGIPTFIWFAISDDGSTDRYYYVSFDGRTWWQLYSESRTAFVTPTRIGLFAGTAGGTGMTVWSWQEWSGTGKAMTTNPSALP